MTKGFAHIFQKNLQGIQHLSHKWDALKQRIIEVLSENRLSIINDIDLLDAANRKAFNFLTSELEHPTISIATAGTTSSGKSSVVNLLCGHVIMPTQTQEISSGVVTN